MTAQNNKLATGHWPLPTARRGFTFTEILIALALILILLIGVSQVFTITSRTIGAGQSLSVAMRAQRATTSASQTPSSNAWRRSNTWAFTLVSHCCLTRARRFSCSVIVVVWSARNRLSDARALLLRRRVAFRVVLVSIL